MYKPNNMQKLSILFLQSFFIAIDETESDDFTLEDDALVFEEYSHIFEFLKPSISEQEKNKRFDWLKNSMLKNQIETKELISLLSDFAYTIGELKNER